MKTCPSCTESYNPEAQFYSTGTQDVCGACHDDWEDEQKEKAEERASLAGLEVPDDFETCAVEGADLRNFDVDAALAGMTNAQAGKLLEMVHDVESLEQEESRQRRENARRAGCLASMARMNAMLMGGGN